MLNFLFDHIIEIAIIGFIIWKIPLIMSIVKPWYANIKKEYEREAEA